MVGPSLRKLNEILRKRLKESDYAKKHLPLITGISFNAHHLILVGDKLDKLFDVIKLLDEAADIDTLLMGELKKKRNQKNPNKAETYGKIVLVY